MKFYLLLYVIFIPIFTHTDYTIISIGDSTAWYMVTTLGYENNTIPIYRSLSIDNKVVDFTFHVRSIIGKTMYSSCNIDFTTLLKQDVLDCADAIIFSFGHVDALNFIEKYASLKNTSFTAIIEPLVNAYISNILSFKKNANIHCPIIIIAIMPPLHNPVTHNVFYKFYGSIANQIVINQLFNAYLHHHAHRNNLLFCNPYLPFTQSDGTLDSVYDAGDGSHFSIYHNHHIIESLYTFTTSRYVSNPKI